MNILANWKAICSDDAGATSIEYAVIASAMAIAIIPIMSVLSSDVDSLYGRVLALFDHPALN